MYVRQRSGLGKAWYEGLLDVVGEGSAAIVEGAGGGKIAGDAIRGVHKGWTNLVFHDKGGGGAASRPAPPPPSAPPGVIMGPSSGPPGRFMPPAPLPPPRRPKKKKKMVMMAPVVNGPSPSPTASEASMLGGGSSKGMLIFGVVSAVAVGIYLLTQHNSKPAQQTPGRALPA